MYDCTPLLVESAVSSVGTVTDYGQNDPGSNPSGDLTSTVNLRGIQFLKPKAIEKIL